MICRRIPRGGLASALAVLLVLHPLAALAGSASSAGGTLVVRDAWARAMPPGMPNAAAYLSIENRGRSPVRLTGAEAPLARRAGIHRSAIEGGMARMRPAGPLTILPGQTLTLEPGGYHVMLMGLQKGLREGGRFPLTLEFDPGGPITVEVSVR